jgi:4-amino-4-deoxy-L-arabinose transferase-like glycosyltransferase
MSLRDRLSASMQARGGIRDHLTGFGLAATYVAVLLSTVRGLGYARDEGFYYRAAQSYAGWFDLLFTNPQAALQRQAVDGAWSANHEHPALVKSLFALSWKYLNQKWHVFAEEGTSLRFGGMIFAGAALWLIYIWGTRAKSRTAGLMAALLFALMPRVFYHSHLDCFDVPIATMWTLCAYAYWRSLRQKGVWWAILTGIAFGLALDTKHNSWFLPVALVSHALLTRWRSIWHGLRGGEVRFPLALLAMAIIGPLTFFALWPWIWFDTVARFTGYVQFHLNHDYYNMVFLGKTYWKPPMPRGYAWLMTAATVPVITLTLFGVGLWTRARRWFGQIVAHPTGATVSDPDSADLLWIIGIAIAYAPWLSNNTPIFGGTKHWMTAYPFMCLFAGVGFDAVAERIRAIVHDRKNGVPAAAITTALAAVVLSAPLAETVHSHPWGLSNYTPLVGGAPGAASLGLNRQFWGFTTGAVADFLNQNARPGDSVYIHDTAWDSWELQRRDGRLFAHVQGAGVPHQGTFALYHHEDHMEGVEYQIWQAFGTASPATVGQYDGVPIVYVYSKNRLPRR